MTHPSSDCSSLLRRRHFFGRAATGIGTAALGSLLARSVQAGPSSQVDSAAHFPARAKRVIYIFHAGGPPQMETYDYKPDLVKHHGDPVPKSVLGNQRLTVFSNMEKQLRTVASPYSFRRHGQCGAWVSDMLPHIGGVVDDMCFIKSMHTESVNHDPGTTYMMSGVQHPGNPSIGSWLSYGLGSMNNNLPSFVVLLQRSRIPDAVTPISASNYGSGFLPSRHQGVKFGTGSDPVLFLNNPPGIDSEARREMLNAGAALNRLQLEAFGDPEISTRIAQYELAYRMQTSVPELTDMSGESEQTFDMYGPDSRTPGTFAANCMLARRLVESGVRYVQLFDRDWDHHRNARKHMPRKSRDIDQPSAALIRDLKQRGLLEDTLVVSSGEFGRSVYCQGQDIDNYGRDHHGACFTSWLAGAGVRGGTTIGKTDDYSFNIEEDPVHVHDFNATILHLLGIDHERLTFRFQGRDYRLTDVHGQVVHKAIA